MMLVMLLVLIVLAALLVFGVVSNIDLTDSILTASDIDKGEFLIGTFLLLFVFIIIAYSLTYKS